MASYKLLVNAPTGMQEFVEVDSTGCYFDETRIVWDERKDGKFPREKMSEVGGLVRRGAELALDATMKSVQDAVVKKDEDKARLRVERRERLKKSDPMDLNFGLLEAKALLRDMLQEMRGE